MVMKTVHTTGSALQRNPVFFIAAIVFLSLVYSLWHTDARHALRQIIPGRLSFAPDEAPCAELQGGEDVFVLLKTGAREARSMVPFHLETTLQCVPNFAIYSDLADTIKGVQILDILSTLPESTRTSSVFDTYRAIQELNVTGNTDYSTLFSTPPGGSKEDSPGWQLDKWKFFPMLRAAHAHPTAEWFLFMETDTNIVWSNLLMWLAHFDSTQTHYLGGQSLFGGHLFAHGGSGFVLSRPAVIQAVAALDAEPERWLRAAEEDCCGDSLLAHLIHDGTDIRLLQSWPMVQGETVASLDFTEKHWCFPIVSQHHMHANETRHMWAFEQAWLNNAKTSDHPILHRDVFEHFVAPNILSATTTDVRKTRWDNISKDRHITAFVTEETEPDLNIVHGHVSPDACRQACHAQEGCMQWMHKPAICALSWVIRMGAEIDTNNPLHVDTTSGWMGDRIEAFRESMQPCDPRWILKDGDGP